MRREGFERQSIEMPKGAAPKKKDTTKVVSFFLVREAGLEPARPEWTLEPESSESANSTTRAYPFFFFSPQERDGASDGT